MECVLAYLLEDLSLLGATRTRWLSASINGESSSSQSSSVGSWANPFRDIGLCSQKLELYFTTLDTAPVKKQKKTVMSWWCHDDVIVWTRGADQKLKSSLVPRLSWNANIYRAESSRLSLVPRPSITLRVRWLKAWERGYSSLVSFVRNMTSAK